MPLRFTRGYSCVATLFALSLAAALPARAQTVNFTVPDTTASQTFADGSQLTLTSPNTSVDLSLGQSMMTYLYGEVDETGAGNVQPGDDGTVSFGLTIDGVTQTFTQSFQGGTNGNDATFTTGPALTYTLSDSDVLLVTPTEDDDFGGGFPSATFLLSGPAAPTPEAGAGASLGFLLAAGIMAAAVGRRRKQMQQR